MNATAELIQTLKGRLAAFGYREAENHWAGDLHIRTVLATPREPRQLLCAVAHLPPPIRNGEEAAGFVSRLRRGLRRRYPGFPWPRRLGTYTVLLCGHEASERLRGQEGRLIDVSGLHVNVLLGIVVVDVETFESRSDVTWGLIDTGEQFKRIQDAVAHWCRRHRAPRRPGLRGGRVLGAAARPAPISSRPPR